MTNQHCIQNELVAIKETLQYLKSQGYQWDNIIDINKGRYCIVLGKPHNIAIMLKSEPFYNFYKLSDELSGVGDSINVFDLKQMISLDVKVLFTKFRDGKLYSININTILNNSIRWINKEGKAIRSWSIHHYCRVDN